jgi:hypothetical protein
MKRRAVAALSALCALTSTPAGAAPRTSVTVVTVVGPQTLPRSTVAAAWTVEPDKSDRLSVSGENLPVAVSTVTASWSGNRKADSRGRFLSLRHEYTYDAVHEGAGAEIVVEYELKGRWYRVMGLREDYVGTIGLTRKSVSELLTGAAPATAGRNVPVRLTLTIRFPQAAANIDDSFVVVAGG